MRQAGQGCGQGGSLRRGRGRVCLRIGVHLHVYMCVHVYEHVYEHVCTCVYMCMNMTGLSEGGDQGMSPPPQENKYSTGKTLA